MYSETKDMMPQRPPTAVKGKMCRLDSSQPKRGPLPGLALQKDIKRF